MKDESNKTMNNKEFASIPTISAAEKHIKDFHLLYFSGKITENTYSYIVKDIERLESDLKEYKKFLNAKIGVKTPIKFPITNQ